MNKIDRHKKETVLKWSEILSFASFCCLLKASLDYVINWVEQTTEETTTEKYQTAASLLLNEASQIIIILKILFS